jgi:hypothetical protein
VERGDLHLVLEEPGWILTGTRESGQIHRFTTHVSHYPAKYAKLVYSTAAPYNAGLGDGLPTPDAMIALHVDSRTSHRTVNEAAANNREGWIRYRHAHEIEGTHAVFDTLIVPVGDLHLRIHRVVEASAPRLPVIEGAAALGFEDGDTPRLVSDNEAVLSGGVTIDHAVAIRCFDSHRRARLPRSFSDGGTGNVVHGRNVIPYLEGELGVGDVAVATVFLGTAAQASERDLVSRLEDRPSIQWDREDEFQVTWLGRALTVCWP